MKHRLLSSIEEIEEIISRSLYCSVAMVNENNEPYNVPMNFGYERGFIYLHSSKKGKKIDILKKKNQVCALFSTDLELRWQNEAVACSYSMRFKSVMAYGHVEFIEEPTQKVQALNCIMKQYSDRKFTYNDPAIREVEVYKIIIDKLDGRVYGY